jgi:hypothetical protein
MLKSVHLSEMKIKLKGSTRIYTFLSNCLELKLTKVSLHCDPKDPIEEIDTAQIRNKVCIFDQVKELTLRWVMSDGIAPSLILKNCNLKFKESEYSFVNTSLEIEGPLYDSDTNDFLTLSHFSRCYLKPDTKLHTLKLSFHDYDDSIYDYTLLITKIPHLKHFEVTFLMDCDIGHLI